MLAMAAAVVVERPACVSHSVWYGKKVAIARKRMKKVQQASMRTARGRIGLSVPIVHTGLPNAT